MNDPLLSHLNAAQKTAVTAKPSHALVIAGAGSGKTRVLVHRIAWLIEREGASPGNIFSVTFTNKAAATMRQRLQDLMDSYRSYSSLAPADKAQGDLNAQNRSVDEIQESLIAKSIQSTTEVEFEIRSMWMGTFHSLCHRFLRIHAQEAGLPEAFQIIDQDDQLKLITQIHKQLSLDETKFPPKKSQWFINHSKDEGLRPAAITIADNNPWTKTYKKVYEVYTEHCERSGLIDFAELLLRCYELFKNNAAILAHYQERFRYLLVDEFQDTNRIQYAWLRLLAGPNSFVMAVGDDDQSIYSWRGARIDHMFSFTKDFVNAKTIRLEQNYRSTGHILKAANAMIANNAQRMGKDLWTDEHDGELISIYAAYNEGDEATFIAEQIRSWVRGGHDYQDAAILYRSNAQSRVLEETFINLAIPYRVYGGQKFFERSEIKDALAYLRLLVNRHDDSAFSRIINTPTRGIGETTLAAVRRHAQEQRVSLWAAAQDLAGQTSLLLSRSEVAESPRESVLNNRSIHFLMMFIELIDTLAKQTQKKPLEDQGQQVLDQSGLMAHLAKYRTEKGLSRLENLQELITAMQQFRVANSQEDSADNGLSLYLGHIALNSSGEELSDKQEGEQQNSVQLMTLHAAKGLEFPLVFLSGMEEGLFPHKMSSMNPEQLEEERRLCYVGMTRAMQKLFITHAEQRYMYGNSTPQSPSRFIEEIPESLVTEAQHSIQGYREREIFSTANSDFSKNKSGSRSGYSASFGNSREMTSKTPAHLSSFTAKPNTEAGDTGLRIGQHVRHPKFGEGVVMNYEGHSIHARVQVKFAREGIKWLILSYANLETV